MTTIGPRELENRQLLQELAFARERIADLGEKLVKQDEELEEFKKDNELLVGIKWHAMEYADSPNEDNLILLQKAIDRHEQIRKI